MKTLWILFVTALVKCDKLDKLYLPPIGANYSGGSFENTVPFEVPEERYTNNNYYSENVPISGIEPEASVGERGSSINKSTGLPSTTSKSVSIFPFSDTRSYDKELLNEPFNNFDSSQDKPAQYSDNYNRKNTDPSKSSVEILADGTPSSLITNPTGANYDGRNPINIAKNGIPQTTNYRYPERISRPQAEADRNAVILNYDNVITPEGFAYSFDTSNGIHADENGTAIDGVKADGSYSYIGDDGKLYNVTYSADENGFRPQGDHLPTSPPIPEAILKVIEQAAIDKSKGIFDDGTYDENKYGYRKYQTPLERFFSKNKPTSTRKYNSNTINQYDNNNLNVEKDGNFNARDKDFPTKLTSNSPFYTSYGNKINNSRRPLTKDDKDVYDVLKSQLVNLNQEPIEDFRQGINEPNNAMDRQSYEIQESTKTSLLNGPLPQIESGYKYPSPKDRFESSQLNNNKGYSKYGDGKIIQSSDTQQSISNKNKDFDGTNQNNIPFIGDERLKQQNNNVNTFTEPEQGYSNGNRDYKYGQRIPSEASTRAPYDDYSTITTSRPFSITRTNTPDEHSASDIQIPTKGNLNQQQILSTNYPLNDQTVKQYDTYTVQPNKFYSASPTERINQFDPYTGQSNDFNGPSSSERVNQLDTGLPNNYYIPSSTDRINQLGTGRPTNFFGPSSTERINKLYTYTGRPNTLNGPSSIDRIKELDRYTGLPTNAYGPSSTERINQIDTYTGRPKAFSGPSSTDQIKQLDTYTGRPNIFMRPSSTERINQLDSYTGRPNDFNGPSSSDRVKQLDRYTGRPTNVYGPSSTERINQLDTYTGRTNDFNGPSSTDRINQLDRYTGRPTNANGPSSTEGINQFDTYTGRPINLKRPSSTERINQLDTYTGRPSDFNGPSSTDRIKQLDIYTDRPTNVYGPSSTEKINQLDTYTGQPNYFYGPSSTERIIETGAYEGKPTDYYGPSSTERIAQFYTDRPNAVYGLSSTNERGEINTYDDQLNFYGSTSTEKIKTFDASSPQISVGDSSPATKIIGEDFIGPKQPQSYDPETGYHY